MKHHFTRSTLALAVAAAAGIGCVTSVSAVNLSDTGLGEVGIVPYYTVRNGFDTNISVVNTSNEYVVAFKIRFRELENSRDARDFNVFLSPNDVWNATVTLGENGVPFIRTADTSCTAPWYQPPGGDRDAGFVETGRTAEGNPIKEMDFTNIDWTGRSLAFPTPDGGNASVERAQEGYIEVIEMGVAVPEVSQLAAYAVHGSTQNCQAIADVYAPRNAPITVTGSGLGCEIGSSFAVGETASGEQAFQAEYCEPLNLLKVSANLINVNYGAGIGLPVTTLANYFNPDAAENLAAPAARDLNAEPGSVDPNLAQAFPATSVQLANGLAVSTNFTEARDATSSLFSANEILNEYGVGGSGNAQTAWVITFPTKNFYVDPALNITGDPSPFQEMFTGSSCVVVTYSYYDREEREPGEDPVGVVRPSPVPVGPAPEVDRICYESQTLSFDNQNLFGSQHNYALDREDGFDSGWLRMQFPEAGTLVGADSETGTPRTFTGLPTIGFSMKTLEKGVAGGNMLNYGVSSAHAYGRSIR